MCGCVRIERWIKGPNVIRDLVVVCVAFACRGLEYLDDVFELVEYVEVVCVNKGEHDR